MNTILISNATFINDGKINHKDILIKGKRIEKISNSISASKANQVFNAEGLVILPGLIDDQVHFREPGLTHKATIKTESRAALAGGITSYIEMPNTIPQTTTIREYNQKILLASKNSAANYSFMFGGTNHNYSEIQKLDTKNIPALKLFLGSSTGNMLVDDENILKNIFSNLDLLIAVHCEDEQIISKNLQNAIKKYGNEIPISHHSIIRSEEACYSSSSYAVELAKETGARLHVFHVSTEKELSLFSKDLPLNKKKITAEACIHHLWFSEEDYSEKGNLIKWNPSIKKVKDREAIIKGINDNYIDIIASDHAPHTIEEKNNIYTQAPSGGPLVQHSLLALVNLYFDGKLSLEKIVQKACHNPAILFQIKHRGFIKEGYFADLVFLNLKKPFLVKKRNLLYKCGWSPFEGFKFKSSVEKTMLNGQWVYLDGKIVENDAAMRLEFDR